MPENANVALIIEPGRRDLGEFSVRRALPDKRRQRIGPFIFFDHIGPAAFPPGSGVNVRSHPHIGLATVTYLFEGEILHRDSLGHVQRILPGAVNWMTAGRGIVHSEKVTDEILSSGQELHGLQTWVALPTDKEEVDPGFVHYPSADIPDAKIEGASRARVIVGSAYGRVSPVKTLSETLFVELQIDAGRAVDIPEAEELGVYVVAGNAEVAGTLIEAGQLAVLAPASHGRIVARTTCHVVFVGGDTLDGERIIWWNFVSSSRQRLQQARDDWRDGRFEMVPGEDDFIPLPTQ